VGVKWRNRPALLPRSPGPPHPSPLPAKPVERGQNAARYGERTKCGSEVERGQCESIFFLKGSAIKSSTQYLLPTAYSQLLTPNCLLPTAYCLLLTAYSLITAHQSQRFDAPAIIVLTAANEVATILRKPSTNISCGVRLLKCFATANDIPTGNSAI